MFLTRADSREAPGVESSQQTREASAPDARFVHAGALPGVGEAAPVATPTASQKAYGHDEAAARVKPAAFSAVMSVIHERGSRGVDSVAHRGGHALGVGLGVVVTEALAAVPSWNAPLVDDKGAPVKEVPGATQIGEHSLRKRHEEVFGPKVSAVVDRIPPGVLRELVAGVGEGATEAPGDSYRLEVRIADMIRHALGD
ncbi:MAG TPA: hypothetical protein VGM90_25995 [Kofleriaceae bacterium]|jgi:hypothetical protein